EHDAGLDVAGDDVSLPGEGAADGVVELRDLHTVQPVRHGGGAGGVRADVITLHAVAAGAGAGDEDAVGGVAGDVVAGRGSPPADRVVTAADTHAALAVGDGKRAGGVGADVVAADL